MDISVFKKLEGSWSLKRTLNNTPLMDGNGFFERQGKDRFLYREEVLWKNGSRGFQSYFYVYDKGSVLIYFSSGQRPGNMFLHLAEKEGVYTGTHHCKQDVYTAEFRFFLPDSMEMTFDVLGPQKDYRLMTILNRK